MDSSWGLLPSDVRQLILKREWNNEANLKARLLGSKPFPIRIGLKPPGGASAIGDLAHFQNYIAQWKSFPQPEFVVWEKRSYRALSEQIVPIFFTLNTIEELIEYVGEEGQLRRKSWEDKMSPFLNMGSEETSPVLVKHLSTIEQISVTDAHLIADVTKQLYAGVGEGKYLRALPLIGVDTKFVETHIQFISDLLDLNYGGAVTASGGLIGWLGCVDSPKNWLTVRPLSEKVKKKMGGFPILQLPSETLIRDELPASRVIVVENLQSGLGLPELEDSLAVIGTGKNVSWMSADWLKGKQVGYWGDIDTWGLSILSDVRVKFPTITALMMDRETLKEFEDRMVDEPVPVDICPQFLNEAERQLFIGLKSGLFKASRLEQERLSADYIHKNMTSWIAEN